MLGRAVLRMVPSRVCMYKKKPTAVQPGQPFALSGRHHHKTGSQLSGMVLSLLITDAEKIDGVFRHRARVINHISGIWLAEHGLEVLFQGLGSGALRVERNNCRPTLSWLFDEHQPGLGQRLPSGPNPSASAADKSFLLRMGWVHPVDHQPCNGLALPSGLRNIPLRRS